MPPLDESTLPAYDDLPGPNGLTGAPSGTTWGLFGDDYELGTLNFINAERVAAAAALVRTGRRYSLNLPLNRPETDESALRPPYRHNQIIDREIFFRDETLDRYNPQGSTQWDGLGHVYHPRYGSYHGLQDEDITADDQSRLSIGRWHDAGCIVARGVLLDIARYVPSTGEAYDPLTRFEINPDVIRGCAAWEDVEIKPGDVLVFRTGVLDQMLNNPDAERSGGPGLGPSRDIGTYLWENRIAAAVADNGGLEVSPRGEGRGLHIVMLPMLGIPMGELFQLDPLAEDCAQDGVYEFMFISVPLNLPGGVGSPANALAIK